MGAAGAHRPGLLGSGLPRLRRCVGRLVGAHQEVVDLVLALPCRTAKASSTTVSWYSPTQLTASLHLSTTHLVSMASYISTNWRQMWHRMPASACSPVGALKHCAVAVGKRRLFRAMYWVVNAQGTP
jgi:hypothetical protein